MTSSQCLYSAFSVNQLASQPVDQINRIIYQNQHSMHYTDTLNPNKNQTSDGIEP